jgi:hypothetical protein
VLIASNGKEALSHNARQVCKLTKSVFVNCVGTACLFELGLLGAHRQVVENALQVRLEVLLNEAGMVLSRQSFEKNWLLRCVGLRIDTVVGQK